MCACLPPPRSLAPSWIVVLNYGGLSAPSQRVIGSAELLNLHKAGVLQVQTLVLAVSSQLQQPQQQVQQQLQHQTQQSQRQAGGSQQGGKESGAASGSSSGAGPTEDAQLLRSLATIMPIRAAFFRWV